MWDLLTKSLLLKLEEPTSDILLVDFSSDGKYLCAGDTTSAIIQLRVTDYVTVNLEAGVGVVGMMSFDDDSDDAAVGLEAILNYNFVIEGSTVVPYVGVAAGGFYVEGETEGEDYDDFNGMAGAQAGTKFFFAENKNFFVEANYGRIFGDDDDTDNIGVLFGLSILF